MNLNSIIKMITKVFAGKAGNPVKGHSGQRGKRAKEMTQAETLLAGNAREVAKRARKAARITRRIGR